MAVEDTVRLGGWESLDVVLRYTRSVKIEDSLMLQGLLRHTTVIMTNSHCQAVGSYGAMEANKQYSPVN